MNSPPPSAETQDARKWADFVYTGREGEALPPFMRPPGDDRGSPRQRARAHALARHVRDRRKVQDAWSAAYQQLELQLDRGSFNSSLRGALLVDFEPDTGTFVLMVRSPHAWDLLQGRLQRMVRRILTDIYGQTGDCELFAPEDVIGQGVPIEPCA